MAEYLFLVCLVGIPALVFIWFLVSLILFATTDKDSPKRSSHKSMLIASSIVAALTVGAVIAFFVLLSIAIAHM